MSTRAGRPLAPGVSVDGFRVEAELPAAGTAALWRVTRADIDFPLVLKVPGAPGGDGGEAVRFAVERQVLPKLTGPHVPRFVASGVLSGLPYCVTEFVVGSSLHDRFASVMFSADAVAALGARIAAALHDIHRQQVIHLDVKPQSVIFRKSGEVVLVDFGLARHAQLPDPVAGYFRVPRGTAAYMAPEQVLLVRSDRRSDIFALGAVLYHLIAGRPPFGNPANAAGLSRRLYHDPPSPRSVNPSCPDWLQEVILGCLEVDPERRFQDAGQVAPLLKNPARSRTARAARDRPGGILAGIARRMQGRSRQVGSGAGTWRREVVPTVMAAVDFSSDAEPLAEALRAAVLRTLEYRRAVRLTCVTVLAPLEVGVVDAASDYAGRTVRVRRLGELKHWALPLRLPPESVTFHVMEAADPAGALIEFARENRVGHIVLGARGSSAPRGVLGGVSERVVAEAPCTVTVVRAHQGAGDARDGGAAEADLSRSP